MLLSTVRPHQVSHTNVHYADWLTIIAQAHSTWSSILLRDVLLLRNVKSAARKSLAGQPADNHVVLMSAKTEKAIEPKPKQSRESLYFSNGQ